jgi:hypothetical protein
MARHNPPIKALQIFRPRWLRASIQKRRARSNEFVSHFEVFWSAWGCVANHVRGVP